MIVWGKDRFDKRIFDLWEDLQKREYSAQKKSPVGVFSVESCESANMVGDILREQLHGECLDIGCGLLPLPAYMKNQPNIKFIGIDPFEDKIEREFDFVAGVGEHLPFNDMAFDGVLFASTIDHMIDPSTAFAEAYRVLKNGGKLFVWFNSCPKAHLGGSVYNKMHQWAFNNSVLFLYITGVGFTLSMTSHLKGSEYTIIATK